MLLPIELLEPLGRGTVGKLYIATKLNSTCSSCQYYPANSNCNYSLNRPLPPSPKHDKRATPKLSLRCTFSYIVHVYSCVWMASIYFSLSQVWSWDWGSVAGGGHLPWQRVSLAEVYTQWFGHAHFLSA